MSVSSDDQNIIEVIKDCLLHCKEKSEQLRQRIVEVLVETAKGYGVDSQDEAASEKLRAYSGEIVGEIGNYALRLSDKRKLVRFNSRVLRSALGFWLESPAAYEHLQENSIEIRPSASRLYKLQHDLISQEGPFPPCYGWFQDERQSSKGQEDEPYENHIAEILFDEMDLQTGVVTNITKQHVSGFTESDGHNNSIDLACEVKRILELSEDESGKPESSNTLSKTQQTEKLEKEKEKEAYDDSVHVAKKVNLFRLRTLYGQTENLEWFFNDGTLTGDDLIGQILRVICLCEIVGVQVYVLIADAGGANSSLFTALRKEKSLEGKVWLEDDLVSFQHPIFPERQIAYVPCAAHVGKACRNNWHRSQPPKGTRDFHYHDTQWGWSQLRYYYEKDVASAPQQTALSLQSIDPDRYSKMGVEAAKAPFQYKTIDFALNELVNAIPSCDQTILILDPMIQRLGDGHDQSLYAKAYQAEKLDRCLEIMKNEVEKEKSSPSYKAYLQRLCAIEYMVCVHGIFISRFFSTDAVLVKRCESGTPRLYKSKDGKEHHILDIDVEQSRMTKYLLYLEDWRQESLKLKNLSQAEWEKTFMSTATYKNIRLAVCGFFCYARMLFSLPNAPFYVPYCHAHQSSIENVFSRSRSMKRDTASGFAKGLLAMKTSKHLSTKSLDCGGMYSSALVRGSEETTSAANVFNRRDAPREKTIQGWIDKRKQIGLGCMPSAEPIPLIRPLSKEKQRKRAQASNSVKRRLAELIETSDKRGNVYHFSEILLQDSDFNAIAKVAIYGEAETFFYNLFTISEANDEVQFDWFCQIINRHLAKRFDQIMNASSRTKKGMNRRLFDFMQSKTYNKLVEKMVPKLKCRLGLAAVVLTLQRHLLKCVDQIRKESLTVQNDSHGKIPAKTPKEIKLLVNRFVGFGLAGLIEQLKDKADQLKLGEYDDDEDAIERQLSLARSMRIFHDEALLQADYLENCYDMHQALKNDGYLALISPNFFSFGERVMTVVVQVLDDDIFRLHGENALKESRARVFEHLNEFLAAFDACCDADVLFGDAEAIFTESERNSDDDSSEDELFNQMHDVNVEDCNDVSDE